LPTAVAANSTTNLDFLYLPNVVITGSLGADTGTLPDVTITSTGYDTFYGWSQYALYETFSTTVPSGTTTYSIEAPPAIQVTNQTYYLRLQKTNTTYTAWFSADGANWLPIGSVTDVLGTSSPLSFGLYAIGASNSTPVTVSFADFRTSTGASAACPAESASDTFDGTSLDRCRWSIANEDTTSYQVQGGALQISTQYGDFWQSRTDYKNVVLQTAPSGDWWIQTQVTAPLNGNYAQAGLVAWQDADNFVKLDVISDPGTSAPNRIEIQRESGGGSNQGTWSSVPSRSVQVSTNAELPGYGYAFPTTSYSYSAPQLTPGATITGQDFSWVASSTLVGDVVDQDGAPMISATVQTYTCDTLGRCTWHYATTDSLGRYSLSVFRGTTYYTQLSYFIDGYGYGGLRDS